MSEMKDSKTSWLGNIPATWKLSRIGSLYTSRNTKVSDKDYPPLSVTMKGVVPQLDTVAKTNAHDDRKLVKTGDFAINSRSDRRGSCGISPCDGSVSLINTILSPNNKMNPRYYNWLFHTVQFADEFYANGHGIVDDLWTTGWQDMKRILIPVPTLLEQEMIASFLDSKCSEIDSLTADIQKEIETLEEYKKSVITEAVTKGLNPDVEMKNSGVGWIGTIPEQWQTIKLKFVTTTRKEKGHFNPKTDKYIGLENIEGYSGRYIETATQYTEAKYNICKKGDIVFNKLRPYLTKAMEIPFDCFCTNELIVFSSFKGNSKYLLYLLLSNSFIDIVNASTYGTKMPRANPDFVQNIEIPIPSKSEQDAIVERLDNFCAEIAGVISTKKQQLANLDEYKKSLIYEYVTGKKEILE